MKNSFQRLVLEGFDLSKDLLQWIPLLEAASLKHTKWKEEAPILALGPTSFARIAMAAVEQYARLKKLNPGTSELLRRNTLNHFLSASIETAFMTGKLTTLWEFAEQNPTIASRVEQERIKNEAQLKECWRISALHAHTTLVAIQNQNLRKGKRGNPGLRGINPTISPEAAFIEILDAQAISKAASLLLPEECTPANIREKIRPVVKDFVNRGLFSFDSYKDSKSETVDIHTRRVTRKFDAEEKLFQSRRRPGKKQGF